MYGVATVRSAANTLPRPPGIGRQRHRTVSTVLTAIAIVAGTVMSTPAHAGVITVIDDFTVEELPTNWPHGEFFAAPPGLPHATFISESGLDTSHVLGGTRETEITVTDAVGGGSVFANANTTNQWFNFSLSSGYGGYAELTYDAGGAGLSFDATAIPSIDRLSIEFVAIDLTTSVTVTINGVSSSAQMVGGGAGTLDFLLTEFAAVDFSDVDDVVVRFDDDTDAVDLRVRIVGFAGPMAPEPATASMTLAGLAFGTVLLRRRKPRHLRMTG